MPWHVPTVTTCLAYDIVIIKYGLQGKKKYQVKKPGL